jgi:peptide/nickel transport system substrate-binding protein
MRSRLALLLLVLAWALPACSSRGARKDSLTILLTSDILSLDPNQDLETVTDSVLFNVFEPLVGFSENLEIRTILAESWEHPKPEQWRLHLRPNVRFHDGTALTAHAVRDALLTLRQGSQLEASDFLSQVQEITAADDLTLDIVTQAPRALLASLPTVYISKPNAKGSFPPLVGTGPYRIREWKPGDHVTLEFWPGYRGEPPDFHEVVFVPVPDPQARMARLVEGSADIVYEVPAELAARPSAGVRILRHASLTVFYLAFNMRQAPTNPFRDLRVRQAFDLALDRKWIIDRRLMGRGTVPTQPIAPLVFGYNPSLPAPTFDPARARQLLAEAGHHRGLETRLDVLDTRLPVAQLVREALGQVGVDVELKAHAKESFYNFLRTGKSDLYVLGWNCSSGESSEFYEFLLHSPTSRYGRGNYGSYSNPTIDRIAETNAAILDQRARRAMLEEAAAVVMQDLPVLPLYVEDDLYGVREDVLFSPRADSEIKLIDVRRATR